MVSATFLGTSPRLYPQYLDTDPIPAGTTLVAEPQNTYQIAIADAWNISGIPGDGLWGEAPRGILTFGITPGFAVIGGMTPGVPSPDPFLSASPGARAFTATPGLAVTGAISPGFPGIPTTEPLMEAVLAPLAAPEPAPAPAVRVVRGRGRKLRPAPARRPGRRRELVGRMP